MASETIDAYRGASHAVAEQIAPTWERRRGFVEEVTAPVRAWMIRELRPQHGDTVLELAAGVGDTGFEVAGLIGERGRLICSDFSEAMLDAARRRGSELEISNVEYRVLDGERIDLDSESVDAVLCRFGYMLMADPAAALAETRRVLRAGGRLTLAVWGAPERNPFFTAAATTLVQRGHIPPPEPGGPGIFAMASEQRTAALLAGAGFDDVRIEEVAVRFAIPDAEEYVQVVADTAGPLGVALQALPAAERAAVTAQCAATLERFATGSGYEIPGVALCAAAR
ncbi:MAG: class I SAM-dependent methyltransferase [Actinobacteria bacterium]|nr:class I SAM-dependent methyltransferase [Actinomycetota bacterium]